MTWSARFEVKQDTPPTDAVLNNVESEEAEYQYSVALAAALSVIGSGALGRNHHIVTITGHANPEHKPTPGWANDCVNISISQVGVVE